MEPGQNPNPPQDGLNPRPRPSMDGFRPVDRSNFSRPVDRPAAAQTPQPPPATPAPASVASPIPQQTASRQPPAPQTPAPTDSQPKQFAPPPKKPRRGRKLLLICGSVLVVAGVLGGGYAYAHHQSVRNRPDTVFKDALLNSLQTPRLQIQTTANTAKTDIEYDLSSAKNPITSSEVTYQQNGKEFSLNGYGNKDSTYFSYTKLPAGVDAKLSSSVINGWIQMRSGGKLPVGSDTTLTQLIDPRSLITGPVLFANLDQKTRQQIVDFELSQKAYPYDITKVEKTTKGNSKVLVFHIKPNVGFIKVANQSLAASMGFTPDDVQSAVDALDSLKGSSWKLYVDRDSHRIIGVDVTEKDGATVSFIYNSKPAGEMPNEPQTKVTWPYFAPYQKQLLDAAAVKTPAAAPAKH
jgi:hypothetical protein